MNNPRICIRTVLSGKVAVTRPNILVLSSGRVDDLNVAIDISISIDFRKVIEHLIRDLGDIELMIADCEEVVVNVLKDRV